MMFRKITSFVVALSVLLLMQFAECQAMSLDQQSMQCCKHMPCNPANKAHDCCKNMVSAQTASVLPSPHVPLSIPVAVPTESSACYRDRPCPGNILAQDRRAATRAAGPLHRLRFPPDLDLPPEKAARSFRVRARVFP